MMKHILLASALATSLVLPVGWTVSAATQTDEAQKDGAEEADAGSARHKGFYATYKAQVIGTIAVAVVAVGGWGVWKYMSLPELPLAKPPEETLPLGQPPAVGLTLDILNKPEEEQASIIKNIREKWSDPEVISESQRLRQCAEAAAETNKHKYGVLRAAVAAERDSRGLEAVLNKDDKIIGVKRRTPPTKPKH